MSARTIFLFAGLLSSGLAGGLLFGWSVSAIPGLLKVSDRTYVSTMQSINREIINPMFLVTFLVPPLVLGVSALLQFRSGQAGRGLWLAVAAVTYAVGVLGVTFVGNVPLNNTLDRFDLSSAGDAALAQQRTDYESAWNRWHLVRTVASVVALALASVAVLTELEADAG